MLGDLCDNSPDTKALQRIVQIHNSGEFKGVQKVDNVQTVQCKEQLEVLDGWFKEDFPSAHGGVTVDKLNLTPCVYPDRRPGRAGQFMEI